MTNSTPSTLTPEEQEQLLQTIEMFEVIVQANPHDHQSMEILKDAYLRLGMKREMMGISRKMAQTLTELGQFSAAIVEYEQILKHEPDNPEVIAALGDVEERMHKAGKPGSIPSGPRVMGGQVEGGGLMTISSTARGEGRNTAPAYVSPGEGGATNLGPSPVDASEALARFLMQNRLAPDEIIQSSLEKVIKVNSSLKTGAIAISLIDEIVRRGAELEAVLSGILDRTKFAYIPLEYYDVDRHVVKMLPEDLTLGRLMVPFDVMSRTVMIATANPFDSAGKEAAQKLLDYHIQWHLASPDAISKVLSQAYRIGNFGSSGRDFSGQSTAPAAPVEAPMFGEVPELKVAENQPTAPPPPPPNPSSPLPDTSTFRLKS